MSSTSANATNEIFCAYAHEDLQYVKMFSRHLSGLQKEGIISCWYDGLIEAGQHWQHEIEIHLNSANIILLFVSADFLNSDFCMEKELFTALDRSLRKEALVIPIIVRPCYWTKAPFAHLQALPSEGKPIATWLSHDEAYTEIVKSISGFVHNQQVPPMRCSLNNLPSRNPLFTGQEEFLQKLHAALDHRKEIALIQAITGLGGIGKTQTAIEYVYRYKDDYTRVIWLNGETILSEVTKLAREIHTPRSYDEDQNNVMQGFLTWLETQRNWLLILDNIEDIRLARSFMPKGNQGHLLLTTRRHAVGGAIEGFSLDVMDEETGATFLLKRAKRVSVEEMQFARRISTELGGLPLALDQAGGYIENTGCSLDRYLQHYEEEHERLLQKFGFPDDTTDYKYTVDTTDYKYTVATTWSLSFEQIDQGKHGHAATDLLRLSAFLAPDRIPVSIFEFKKASASAAMDLLGPGLGQVAADFIQLEEVLEALLRYSLIQREDDTFSIHRLIQTVLRDTMTKEECSLWIERAIRLMSKVFPDPHVEYWVACVPLFPHMRVCTKWIADAHIRTETSACLLNLAAGYLQVQCFYKEAEPLMEQALEIRQEILGDHHSETAGKRRFLSA